MATNCQSANDWHPLFSLSDAASVTVGEELGRGTVGRVYAAEWVGLPVAVKELRPLDEITDELTRNHAIGDFATEQSINAALGYHPNIVAFLGLAAQGTGEYAVEGGQPQRYGLVFEHVRGGKLEVGEYGIGFRILDTISVALCVARGLAHAHRRNVMHRDIKPSNVLCETRGVAKICDWGLAVRVDDANKSADTVAPEVFLGRKYDQTADVFSFGILLYSICEKTPYPYQSTFLTPTQVVSAVASRGLRPQVSPAMSRDEPELVDLMQRCWSHEVSERPTMDNVSNVLFGLLRQNRAAVADPSERAKSQSWSAWLGF